MPIQIDGTAPYAPVSVIVDFLNRNRNGGIPAPVTLSTLERLGVSESLRPRTLQALKLLDFIDEAGNLTDEFTNLRKVSTPEYPAKLSEMLRAAYADVFAIVEPSGATHQQITDAFRGFTPAGQIDRMVSLFLGLLNETGLWGELPSSRDGTAKKASRRAPSKPTPPRGKSPTPAVSTNPSPALVRPSGNGYSQSVELAGGAGTVTLSADVNPMKLKGSVRDFFYSLVDAMDDYEQKNSATQGGES